MDRSYQEFRKIEYHIARLIEQKLAQKSFAVGGGGGGGGGSTTDLTATEILTRLKTVDGAGSGLDADIIRGIAPDKFTQIKALVDQDMNGKSIVNGLQFTAQRLLASSNANPGLTVGDGTKGYLKVGATGWYDDGSYFALLGTRTVHLGIVPVTSGDANTVYTLGRGVFGYVGHSDYVGVAHRDQATVTDYGFLQSAVGDSFINHPTGKATYLRSNNTTLVSLDDDYLRMFSTLTAMQTDNYASQNAGWRHTYTGQLDTRYIYVDEMHAKAFIADLEMALAGSQMITKSVAPLALDFTVPNYSATATLTLESFAGFPSAYVLQNGDTIGIKINSRSNGTATSPGSLTIAWVFGTVVSSSIDTTNKRQAWTFTRLSSSTINGFAAGGTASAGTVIGAGAIALDFGVSGDGYYEVSAIDGQLGANAPYMQIVTWDTHPIYDRRVRSRYGNLNGLSIADFGMVMGPDVSAASTTTFDFRSSTGTVRFGPVASGKPNWYWDGTTMRLRVNTSTFVFANSTEFGMQTTDGTRRIVLNTSGDSYFDGLMTISSTGEIRQGTGTLGSNFGGFRQRNVSGMGRFSLYANDVESVLMDSGGIDLLQDTAIFANLPRALKWWGNLASRSGDPAAMISSYATLLNENALYILGRGNSAGKPEGIAALQASDYTDTDVYELRIDSYGTLTTDAKLGGSWAALTPATGWANAGGGLGTLAIKKFGDMVGLKGRCAYSSGGSVNVMVNLNTQFRPSEAMTVACVTSLGGSIALREVRVRSNGDVGPSGWTPGSGDWVSLDGVTYYL